MMFSIHHDGEQLCLYQKVYIKTQSKKKEVLVIFILQETKNSNFFLQKLYSRERQMPYSA